jgi:predicted transcriptional regulator
MDEFIRKSIKEYENATLIEGETQVVAGTNYRYVYKVVDQQGRKTLDEVTSN